MTNEERDLITQFVARTGGRPAGGAGFAGSVPLAGGPALPPVDAQADALLADLFTRYPEARYRITQLAFVQEHALAAATNQIQQLQAQIQQMQQQQAAQPAASPWGQPAQPQPSRGFLGGLFGGGNPAPQPQPQQAYGQPAYAPPPPQYAPGYQPGMFQSGGSGFLGSALRTATGVAGGILAADALSNLFSSHNQALGAGFGGLGGGFGGGQTVIVEQASPWGAPAIDPMDQGGAAKDYPAADSGWSNAAPDSGWQDASASDSGWTDSGSTDFDNT